MILILIISLQLVRFLPNDLLLHKNFVDIIPDSYCGTNVGNLFKQGLSNGRQELALKFEDAAGWQACGMGPGYGLVIHELCHTLGTFIWNSLP